MPSQVRRLRRRLYPCVCFASMPAARRVKAIFGWIYGDLGPNGHGYFLVPIPATDVSYRVTVQSFDVVSGGT